VKLVIAEPGGAELVARVEGCQLICSVLGRLEVLRAVRRIGGDVVATERSLARVVLRRIDAEILVVAAHVGPPTLGSLDSIHLATALAGAPAIEAFITYDRQLGHAAEAAGFSVEAPGL
jgi:predicted nucleic acid-binding protein